VARLRRFLMLEKAREGREEPAAGNPSVSDRFGAAPLPPPPPEPAAADPFAPPPDPVVHLELDAPERPPPPPPDGALAAEIDRMSARREEIGMAAATPRYRRQIDRLAALIAVGPLARWSPRARVALVAGAAAAAIAALSFVPGIGPRVLQAVLALLLFALFVPS
jgi:hypothetical protein